MTREEAIKYLHKLYGMADMTDEYGDMIDTEPYEQALEMAINALKQEPCEDCISRQAVIEVLNKMDRYVADELTLCDTEKKFPKNEVFIVDDVYEEIVEQLPSVAPQHCEDCISRQAVLDVIKSMSNANPSYWNKCDVVDRENLLDEIAQMPPVTPQPKMGKWNSRFTEIKGNNTFNCMECGSTFIVVQGVHNMNYCPNCGQPKMESKEP